MGREMRSGFALLHPIARSHVARALVRRAACAPTYSIGHGAPGEPLRKGAKIGRPPIQPDLSAAQGFGQRRTTKPDLVESRNIGRYDQVDVEARVLETDRPSVG